MFVEEHPAKRLLTEGGIPVPRGELAGSPDKAAQIAERLQAPVAIKAQVPAGRRGKAGGVRFADRPAEAREATAQILGARLGGFVVEHVLVEERVSIARELYAAVTNDAARACPLLLFASEGGMDIEEIHAKFPDRIVMVPLDVRRGLEAPQAHSLLQRTLLPPPAQEAIGDLLVKLYRLYRKLDAELLEINPLALTAAGGLVALDCKLVIDDSAVRRQTQIPVARLQGTSLEMRARAEGLLYVELEGNVAILANGAGLTMSTMDAVTFYGGRPANFMEIGGDAYKKGEVALSIVLGKPGVKSLLVNLCGAFARTDVMAQGIVRGWQQLKPQIPVAFSIHGTGEEEAIRLVREQLGIEPYEEMDDAVRAAIDMARPA